MLKEAEVSQLLGRTLTTTETTNFKLYLKIATTKVEQLLCFKLQCDGDEERTFDARENYQTLFVDPFTSITKVEVNGNELTDADYTVKLDDSYSSSWYNSIVFTDKLGADQVKVTAAWGFDYLPVDLKLFLAQMFSQNSVSQKPEGNVKSKEVEDFRITYKDTQSYDDFLSENSSVIAKYSLCSVGEVQNGYTYDRI